MTHRALPRQRSRHTSPRVLSVLLPLVLLAACGGSGGDRAVSRTTVGDTLFVVSHRPAVDSGPLFAIERELSIGVEEGDDAYLLVEGRGSIP